MFGADAEDRYPSMKRILAVLTSMQLSRPWATVRESTLQSFMFVGEFPGVNSCFWAVFLKESG